MHENSTKAAQLALLACMSTYNNVYFAKVDHPHVNASSLCVNVFMAHSIKKPKTR